jgi:hypothetical protein|uniref:Uncharacterized protein n=1 Tax=uncultured Caudovirales phage TaxID=2100421 RepID=A0A6J5KVF3_9CAUD|nr:hypothetical protein UFOVP88_35 [uncultured Caudovirales phage]
MSANPFSGFTLEKKSPTLKSDQTENPFDKFELPESAGKSLARTIYQPISGIMSTATYPMDMIAMAGGGEALAELEDLKERFGNLIDEDKYKAAVNAAMSSFPTQGNIERGIESATGLPLEAKTQTQKNIKLAFQAGKMKPGSIVDKTGALEKTGAALTAPAVKSGLQAAGVPEPLSEIGGLGVSQAITKGKFIPKNALEKEAYEGGKFLGLTDEQLTPLFQGDEGKLGWLGKFATKTNKAKAQLEGIGKKFGDIYSDLKTRAKSSAPLSKKHNQDLTSAFTEVSEDLKLSQLPPADKKLAIKETNNLIKKLKSGKFTQAEMIATYQDLNKVLKRGGVGQKPLVQVKKAIMNALHETDKNLAKDFELTNNLYSRYKNFSDSFTTNLPEQIVEGLVMGGETYALAHGIFTGNLPVIASVLGEKAARRVATNLLTNPSWQSIHKNAGMALKESSVPAMGKVAQQVNEKLTH